MCFFISAVQKSVCNRLVGMWSRTACRCAGN